MMPMRLIRRMSRVADSSSQHASPPAVKGRRKLGTVSQGHVPMCVGEEMERFAVPAEVLGRPAFLELLRRSAQEYGYEQRGVLRIPCPVPLFRRLLVLSSSATADELALDELLRSLPEDLPSSSPADLSLN